MYGQYRFRVWRYRLFNLGCVNIQRIGDQYPQRRVSLQRIDCLGSRGEGIRGRDDFIALPISATTRLRCNAAVQELTAIACLTPRYSAKARSNSRTLFPVLIHLEARTWLTASISVSSIQGRLNGIKGFLPFFNFSLRFGKVRLEFQDRLRILEETPKQKPFHFVSGCAFFNFP